MTPAEPERPSIDFGTSGLRGPAASFTPEIIAAYIGAFLAFIGGKDGQNTVYLAADLRKSSPAILANCVAGIRARGWQAVYGGNVPTPALAAYALARACPAIMVTGSHIPEDYNGIKFYRRNGELLKGDETLVREGAMRMLDQPVPLRAVPVPMPGTDATIAKAYVARFVSAFAPDTLAGLRIGVDQHSAVGRDLLVEILTTLGATCFPFRRLKEFVAVDTEALSASDLERAKIQIKENALDAVVSTDGDGDRPLLIDANGIQINGDVLGALTAHSLRAQTVVTPLSSTSAIETSGWFAKTVRTRIGSPHVVAAMATEEENNATIVGFEANGGFLQQSEIMLPTGRLPRLPTRDAMLPLIAVLGAARDKSSSLSALAGTLPDRFMKAGRIKHVLPQRAFSFLKEISTSKNSRTKLNHFLAEPVELNLEDGVRMIFADSTIVHFRQSGNAPEMRIYVETGDRKSTERLLSDVVKALDHRLTASGVVL